MLLRRVIDHVKAQNWTAVALDFVIVVVGVFIGIQVANWNAARGARAEYERALARLSVEIDNNLAMLDQVEPQTRESLETARRAFETLRSCKDSPENRAIVNEGLAVIRSTSGVHLRRKAVEELTSNASLLAQQSVAERRRFTDLLFYFDLIESEAAYAAFNPLDGRVENNPLLAVGDIVYINNEYVGFEYSKPMRPLVLAAPVDVACADNQLVKSFFNWERWQDNIPVGQQQIRKQLETTKAMLEGRR